MLTKEELPACPVATTVNLIGNKWKILILRDLLTGKKRFGELRKSVSGISQKVLTDNLRALEEDGIVLRAIFAEVPPRVEYSLSELGETLRPIIEVMEEWGTTYKARFEKPKTKKG
jgi:DNA-binding HxlR family transcriptional regulator